MKTDLYTRWSASLSSEESTKADEWRAEGRQEGRQSMLESVKSRLAAADSLAEQLITLEAAREADRLRAEKRLETEIAVWSQELSNKEARFMEYRKSVEADIDKRLEEKLAVRLRVVTEEKEQEQISLIRQNAMLTSQLNAADSSRISESQRHAQEIATIRSSIEQSVSQRLEDAMKVQISNLELVKEQEISQLRTQLASSASLGKLLESANESLQLMRGKIESLESSNGTLQTQLSHYTETKSSHAIGVEGEATVLELIENYVLPEFLYSSVVSTAGIPHSADHHVRLMSAFGKKVKILVDAKNYKDAVRKKEITKLHNDVDLDDEANGGILLSLNSPISTVKQFQIERTNKGKMILYLSMYNLTNENRGRVLCWGFSILSSLVSEQTPNDKMEKISYFLTELDLSSKDADQTFKNCEKAMESARTMKTNLAKRLCDFRIDDNESSPVPTPIAKKTRAKRAKSSETSAKPSVELA